MLHLENMNKRIKELASQTGITDNNLSDGNMSYNDLEKFAVLIVRECADFADEHNDYSEGVTLGVGRALKKHFGVEE